MIVLEAETAAEYLVTQGWTDAAFRITAKTLSGGVSNRVILVCCETANPPALVLKQARRRLQVAQLWECGMERVFREIDTLKICQQILAKDVDASLVFAPTVPRLVFEDRENFVFAMTAAPDEHVVWKEQLLAGTANVEIARACGHLLAKLHGDSWLDPDVCSLLDDTTFFDDLRLDPYYRQISRVHGELRQPVAELLESLQQHKRCLVHGDFSPKNLLVTDNQVILLDFEVGHFGDPAFDLGFFLTHLVIKAIRADDAFDAYWQLIDVFWTRYLHDLSAGILSAGILSAGILSAGIAPRELELLPQRVLRNLGACLIARVDGKSPVDYLPDADQSSNDQSSNEVGPKSKVRQTGWSLLTNPPQQWSELHARIVR